MQNISATTQSNDNGTTTGGKSKKGAPQSESGDGVSAQAIRLDPSTDEGTILRSRQKDYGLDVDLDAQNRLVADKAGQVIFGAPNGVGINYKPSGDFALDVLGAIYATEPSQLGVSDRRVKTNFREVEPSSCLASVRSLRLTDFRFKSTFKHAPKTGARPDGKHRGFIAQEVDKVLPAAVWKTKYVAHLNIYLSNL
jgi:hypothetical protein